MGTSWLMPQFFFDVARNGTPHPFGLEITDLDAVRHIALKTACGIVREHTSDFWANGGEWQMSVTDDCGMTLFILTFFATEAPVVGHRSPYGQRS